VAEEIKTFKTQKLRKWGEKKVHIHVLKNFLAESRD
jgi:hypothetical protein